MATEKLRTPSKVTHKKKMNSDSMPSDEAGTYLSCCHQGVQTDLCALKTDVLAQRGPEPRKSTAWRLEEVARCRSLCGEHTAPCPFGISPRRASRLGRNPTSPRRATRRENGQAPGPLLCNLCFQDSQPASPFRGEYKEGKHRARKHVLTVFVTLNK